MTTPDPTTAPAQATGPAAGADVLWQHLTDALNALASAGQFPHFHNLYGPRNDWQRQPYITSAHAYTPWVVYDLATRKSTVSSRERVHSAEHSQRPRRSRRCPPPPAATRPRHPEPHAPRGLRPRPGNSTPTPT
ncbi:hypothetical protein [Streptomyces sp. DSM 118148]|uniref:hypothetical protein n=1 Tax=Streptomyces sp. DSM 118148 TaxID=3448667 RepID=UPI0040402BFD